MGSKKAESSTPAKRLRRKPSGASRRLGNADGGASVSEKLEALKSLVPSESNDEMIRPEQLFQETAEYIVRLRTQVIVLQKLIDFYGSHENPNSV